LWDIVLTPVKYSRSRYLCGR